VRVAINMSVPFDCSVSYPKVFYSVGCNCLPVIIGALFGLADFKYIPYQSLLF
jgi:hypothetical protein